MEDLFESEKTAKIFELSPPVYRKIDVGVWLSPNSR
jgi:hypothetical protein